MNPYLRANKKNLKPGISSREILDFPREQALEL